MTAWIGVDFDGTLAHYENWGDGSLGEPIVPMVERVKAWLAAGKTVKIFTARVGCTGKRSEVSLDDAVFAGEQRDKIMAWCLEHIGQPLEVTATKDFQMSELYDDRAVQVIMNTGMLVGRSTRGH